MMHGQSNIKNCYLSLPLFFQHHSRAWMTYRLDEHASFPVLPNLLPIIHPTLTRQGLTF